MFNKVHEEVYGLGRFSFPIKLHALLCQAAELQIDNVISWDKTGTKFIIYNEKEFVSSILPKIFKQSKFTSFRRQLNAYGFQRESKNLDIFKIFSHIHFRRYEPRTCRRIYRESARPPILSNEMNSHYGNQFFENPQKIQQALIIAEMSCCHRCRGNRDSANKIRTQYVCDRTDDNPIPTSISGDEVLDRLVEEIFGGETEKELSQSLCEYDSMGYCKRGHDQ